MLRNTQSASSWVCKLHIMPWVGRSCLQAMSHEWTPTLCLHGDQLGHGQSPGGCTGPDEKRDPKRNIIIGPKDVCQCQSEFGGLSVVSGEAKEGHR